MKYLWSLLTGVFLLLLSGVIQPIHAQDYDWGEQRLFARSFNEFHAHWGPDGAEGIKKRLIKTQQRVERGYYPKPCASDEAKYAFGPMWSNSDRCQPERDFCLHGMFASNEKYIDYKRHWLAYQKRGITNYTLGRQEKFKQCGKKVWELVKAGDFDGLTTLADHLRNGTLNQAGRSRNRGDSTKPQPSANPIVQPVQPPPPRSGGTSGGRHDYGTDIDDLDASDIEIMDVVEDEEKPASASTPTGCQCYAGDSILHGICNTTDPNSPYYNKRNAKGELISLYETGEYPWTSACQHPIGGRANLQEWYDNYNSNRR